MARALKLLIPVLLGLALFPAAGKADPCAPLVNPVACENSKPGDPPADWKVSGAGDPTIQGFATQMSVNVGQTIQFKVKTDATKYHVDILRLGYYGGDGARLIASNIKPLASLPQTQPSCLTNSTTGLIDCGNWGVSASWTVPGDAVSGVYIAHLVRDDTGGDSQIPFVVRNDSSHSKIVVQTSDETWEAYNAYGGNSLYSCTVACPPGNPDAYKAAFAVSYNRPFDGALATDGGQSYLYAAEYQMIRWLERNGYDVSYVAGADVDRAGALIKNHQVFMASGHDEYWTAGQRANVEAARDAGVSLAFFTGNEVFWKTRWTNSGDGTSTPYRTLVTYKETHFNTPVDPQDPSTWTGSWVDPRFSPPADGGNPSNALTGQLFVVNAGTSDIKVPAQYGKLRFWRGTQAASLTAGQTLTLSPGTGTLGYEWDSDVDNGFRPPGLIDMSSTTVSGVQAFTDYGSTTNDNATATHHLTLYRAPSGALVFGAGTVQWSWGLDNTNAWDVTSTDPSGHAPDTNIEQATVNLFADMGVQPGTLRAGLVGASASSDTTAPTTTITSPTAGTAKADGSSITISGTSTDSGGGVVAGVEVSTDGGASWHPVSGVTPGTTASWSYTAVVHGQPTMDIRVRATDDSGNIESPPAGVAVNVSCDCSIWGNAVTPPNPDSGDGNSIEVGVKFKSDKFGTINGIRFYKSAANTGTHVGTLWSASGQKLASVTFSGESASGWQDAKFSTPVAILPNTTYVASYFAPNGHYAATSLGMYKPGPVGGNLLDSPPLHALKADGTNGNGLYAYTGASTFPTDTFRGSNYWVDVDFSPASAPGAATGVSATAGPASATVSWTAPSSGGPVTSYKITPYIGSTAQTATTINGTPPDTSVKITGLTPGQAYTFTVRASNPAGDGPESGQSNSVTPVPITPPGAPTGVSAHPGSNSALVQWTPPASDGGDAISGYTITPFVGATAQPAVTAGASATSKVVTGLTNGTDYTFKVTATNGKGDGPASSASNTVTPQDTIFDFGAPALVDAGDPSSVELGLKFSSDTFGLATGVRFYKAAANTGTHVGSLWTATGQRLASVTFTNETASGWQEAKFSTPVAIDANVTYVVSYLAPNGHYSATSPAFASIGVDNPPLHALSTLTSANGVYSYTGSSRFPTDSFNASNYWVDVMFGPATPPGQVTGVQATAGTGSATVSWSAPAGGGPVTKYTVTPYIGSAPQTAKTVTGSPPATSVRINGLTGGQTYTFKVQASNPNGAGAVSAASNAVTPPAPVVPGAPTNVEAHSATAEAQVSWTEPADDGGSPITGYTITPYVGGVAQATTTVNGSTTSTIVGGLTNGNDYTFKVKATSAVGNGPDSSASNQVTPDATIFDLATPAVSDSGDYNAIEVGVRFKADVDGVIDGIRYYRDASNQGPHRATLWTDTGTPLATAAASGETPDGWQEIDFATPVSVTAGTTYVASYFAPGGHYSATSPAFASAGVDNGALHALVNTGTEPNGVYAYASSSTFPTNSFNASNYWVDVLFRPGG